ncbi:MAG: MBL fold metallo-hydrolase [Lachnospiraceae bacterium]|nr:MBL fold metallo-hydrolase [Lachnospiraceae bacterium]
MIVHELKYSATNTYLVDSGKGLLLFDTGWAGTFSTFCRACGQLEIPVQQIDVILISHFHPDHYGIAGQIAQLGPKVLVMDRQRDYLHAYDEVLAKDQDFEPINEEQCIFLSCEESEDFLAGLGIDGKVIPTPGHSDDSISLWLSDGTLFVGDLNPLYELEAHRGTQIAESWDRLLDLKPEKICYGHARTWERDSENEAKRCNCIDDSTEGSADVALVSRIMKLTDKGMPKEKIQKKTGADPVLIEDVIRMYLTHRNVGVAGILDRIEIKNR